MHSGPEGMLKSYTINMTMLILIHIVGVGRLACIRLALIQIFRPNVHSSKTSIPPNVNSANRGGPYAKRGIIHTVE